MISLHYTAAQQRHAPDATTRCLSWRLRRGAGDAGRWAAPLERHEHPMYIDVAMTELLEKAFAEASKLPPEEQDFLARMLLDDLASEESWEQSFARSQDELSRLAGEALAEDERGETKPLEEIL